MPCLEVFIEYWIKNNVMERMPIKLGFMEYTSPNGTHCSKETWIPDGQCKFQVC